MNNDLHPVFQYPQRTKNQPYRRIADSSMQVKHEVMATGETKYSKVYMHPTKGLRSIQIADPSVKKAVYWDNITQPMVMAERRASIVNDQRVEALHKSSGREALEILMEKRQKEADEYNAALPKVGGR